jgi:hypothetical protein
VAGLFAEFQPIYAAQGISTFPCSSGDKKKPLVGNFLRMGVRASTALARKFTDSNAIGLATGKRNGITVLDIDVPDQSVLHETVARHGEPRVIVRTASGKHHLYYKHGNERRRIRPWSDRPIDLLGEGGFVMAPPSLFGRGAYQFVHGTLHDFRSLTPIRGIDDLNRQSQQQPTERPSSPLIPKGKRNNALWRECMRHAHQSEGFDHLLDFARMYNNKKCSPPLEESELMTIAQSAWDYTEKGLNRFGQHGAWFPVEEVMGMQHDPDAFLLLAYLRAHNGPCSTFMCANGLAETFSWDRRRFAAARARLLELDHIVQIRSAGRGNPALFQWK